MLARLDGPPQTNETQRSAALAPGFLTVAADTGLPLATSEIGASAGLNLLWDRFAYAFGAAAWGDPASPVRLAPDWQGPPPPMPAAIVAERAGCDRAPLDPPARPTACACSPSSGPTSPSAWPAPPPRSSSPAPQASASSPPTPPTGSPPAGDPRPGRAQSSTTRSSGSTSADRAGPRPPSLDAAGARATPEAPLAWLRIEGDGLEPGAAVTLTLWPGGETRLLGRADFHGAWVRWTGW